MGELGFKSQQACQLFYDNNKMTISISENLVQYDKTKHVEVAFHQRKYWQANNCASLARSENYQLTYMLIDISSKKILKMG